MNSTDKLSDVEKKVFDELRNESHLFPRQKVVSRLKNEGLINSSKKHWWNLAAAAIIFFVGISLGLLYQFRAPAKDTYNYMLVLYEDQEFRAGDPQQMFEEYSKWMNSVEEMGVAITGQELRSGSLIVSPSGYEDNPKITVSGFFLLQATSITEVKTIASGSPHITYGGRIEIKEYMKR